MGREAELFKAAQTGNIDYLERMFAAYLTAQKDQPPLKGKGRKQANVMSLKKSANPNMQDDQGYTLLHHATLNGQRETVSLLLRCGASTTIPDCSGSSPLHLAAWKGDVEIVKILVSQGPSRANVNDQSDADNTALHLASQYGYSEVVDYLLQRHADPILHNTQGETPLDLAAQYGHLDTVHLLISHCPELLSLSRGKFSPLHLAARNGHTLVALSLINAGISVNAMGEHGTPLHEAAMFGKGDTVKMLLDKGASIEAKDRASKSVLDALSDFPAEKAKEIRKMIEEHKEEVKQSGVSSHVVAVTKTTCKPVSDNSSALHYAAGDHIMVLRRTSSSTFEGSLNGKSGSFMAKDVVFHKENGGHLAPVKSLADIFPSPSPPPPSLHSSLNHTPTPSAGGVNQPQESPPPQSGDPCHGNQKDLQASLEEPWPTSLSEKSLPAKMKKLSKKEKRFQLSRDDGAYCELSTIDPLAAQSEFGDNLRLNPVGPAFATGPSASSKPVSGDAVTAHNCPDPSEQPVEPEQDQQNFVGSYYVLEVGNFTEESTEAAALASPSQNGAAVEAKNEGRREEEGGVDVPAAYYMLDMEHFDNEESTAGDGKTKRNSAQSHRSSDSSITSRDAMTSPTPGSKGAVYQNVTLKPTAPLPRYENISVHGQNERQKSSPRGIPEPTTVASEVVGVGSQEDATVMRRISTSLPTRSTMAVHVNASKEPVSAASATEGRGKKRSLSQNSEFTSGARGEDPPRQRQQRNRREQIYEKTTVSFPKRSSQKSKRTALKEVESSGTQAVVVGNSTGREEMKEGGMGEGTDEGKLSRERREKGGVEEAHGDGKGSGIRDKEGEVDDFGGNRKTESKSTSAVLKNSTKVENDAEGTGAAVAAAPGGNMGSGASETREDTETVLKGSGEEELSTKLMESNGLPFAGLVISSSAPPTAVTDGDMMPAGRPRAETIWDDERVESEWSQIDSLLNDMRGSIDTSLTLSPQHEGSNHTPPTDIQSWLSSSGMEKYRSLLETNGFDSLLFLGGGMLINEDLEDIGITDQEDQLTLLATSRLLPPPPSLRAADSVSQWLEDLQLSQLADKFEGLSLQKISKMWDIELTSTVGVELLGHRRRLLYGVSELCSAHPEWSLHTSPVIKYRQREPSLRQPMAPSLCKDYTRIQPSAQKETSSSSSSPIELRSPMESQEVSGVARPHSLPSSSWQHNNSALIAETVNYSAKYLGSVIVVRVRGTQSTEEACLRLRTSTENMKKLPDIVLSISWKGIKFVDGKTKMVVSTHSIQDISYSSQDIEDKRVFAYITKDKTGMFYCHVFMAPSVEVSDEVVMTIGQAFEIAYQKVMKARTRTTPPK